MKKTFTIDVTQEDIRMGHRRSCIYCPIALAMGRATGRIAYLGDHSFRLRGVEFDELTHSYPKAVRQFIDDFDAGLPVAPFSFPLTIDLPEGVPA